MTHQSLPLISTDLNHALRAHASRLTSGPMRHLLDARSLADTTGLVLDMPGLSLEALRQRLDSAALADLHRAADESGLPQAIEAMFSGQLVNNTEKRPALHTALRDPTDEPLLVDGQDVRPWIAAERARCRQFAGSLSAGLRKGATGQRITDVVNIGIGGSDLGPVMALEALKGYVNPRLRMHFISNVDGTQFADVAAQLEPACTLFIICSKTFSTQETLANAALARQWIVEKLGVAAVAKHFAAVSVNHAAMDEFGLALDARFTMWDWVGGRYSIWSAIGLILEIGIGTTHFEEFLNGAQAMDAHFRTQPLQSNLPVLHGLLGVWNRNFLNLDSLAVLPYDQRLHRFPAYLQQLMMESSGKSVRRNGEPVSCQTGAVIWGEPGSNGQHSFFQLLHQGTSRYAMDFLIAARSSVSLPDSHQLAVANGLAQAEAFARGYTLEEARAELHARGLNAEQIEALAVHKVHAGDRPSSLLLFAQLDPHTLGALVALYEHSVFVQSVLWDINPFDQWGVELGKKMALSLLPMVRGQAPNSSGVSAALSRLQEWSR